MKSTSGKKKSVVVDKEKSVPLKTDMKMPQVKIVLRRSLIGSTKQQKSAVYCLGLKKLGQSVVLDLSPVVKGQINKIKHLISLEGNNIEER